jgi:hypothetical protein
MIAAVVLLPVAVGCAVISQYNQLASKRRVYRILALSALGGSLYLFRRSSSLDEASIVGFSLAAVFGGSAWESWKLCRAPGVSEHQQVHARLAVVILIFLVIICLTGAIKS